VWSDTVWLAPLFLASAASTGLATMLLIAWWKGLGTPAARQRLEGAEPLVLCLELLLLGAFLVSLGDNLGALLMTFRGNILVFGTLAFGVLLPLLLHVRIGDRQRWGVPAVAASVLLGGLLLRYGAVSLPHELLQLGPSVTTEFSPEAGRKVGGRGADIGNHGAEPRPRSKLSPEEQP
jgi:formate-dependent nitrite reductase membrane component NrfD